LNTSPGKQYESYAVGGGGIMIFGALIGQMIFKKIYADILVPEPVERDKVTFHALRHSFATHLLGKWVDIKYIKDLFGHFDIKTTERYLHVAREKLVVIQSPLDYLDTNI
jgi:site-specific recombinase XerD